MCTPTDPILRVGTEVQPVPVDIAPKAIIQRVVPERWAGHLRYYRMADGRNIWACKVKRLNADSSHELW